jgi:carboxylesterase
MQIQNDSSYPDRAAFARLAGDGSPAALLLHGLAGSPAEMHYLGRRLSQAGFVVSAPAVPGCAFGTRSDPFDSGKWMQWVEFASDELESLYRKHGKVCVAGLCVGTLLALRLAVERPDAVAALSLISITLQQDGWATPWYMGLMRMAGHTPLRRRFKLHERFPYGLKNERLRDRISRAMATEGSSSAGAAFIPLSSVHEGYRISDVVKRDIGQVKAPCLVMHAFDDDVAHVRNAEFVARNVGSEVVRTVFYRDSYHILTMDNDKDMVAEETIAFFQKHGAAAERARSRDLMLVA